MPSSAYNSPACPQAPVIPKGGFCPRNLLFPGLVEKQIPHTVREDANGFGMTQKGAPREKPECLWVTASAVT
jgi:hypothetical protein